jgi:hypothetical protein
LDNNRHDRDALLSNREMADIYTRTIGAITEAYYVAFTHMATNMLFAGIEATTVLPIIQDRIQKKQQHV